MKVRRIQRQGVQHFTFDSILVCYKLLLVDHGAVTEYTQKLNLSAHMHTLQRMQGPLKIKLSTHTHIARMQAMYNMLQLKKWRIES
jgi:hypothetical protein